MHRARKLFAVGTILLATSILVACGSSEEKAKKEAEAKTAADWSALQQKKGELDAKRQEYRQLKEQMENAPAEAGDAPAGDLEAQATALKAEIDGMTDALGQQIADFINSQGIEVGGQLTEIQQQALHFNSDEALVNARDYIEKAGDWQRALDIYRGAKAFDPNYAPLDEAIAEAEQMRFMTEERFAQAKKKMSQKEVRAALGPVKTTNVRDFPDRNVTGWFYPKEDGGAAGIYFRERKKGEGDWEVYSLDFNAVKPPSAGGEADTSEGEAPVE
ncbi:MAG: hypothetical protein HC897_16010 [Thermoanaerobaculia bacterium]|nr:hypothetical protein [Thermoanaerobaculia bacterium]